MFKNIENLKIRNIHKGLSKQKSYVKCRKGNSFILRITGSVRYTFADFYIDVHPGDVAFLPDGSSYEFETLGDTQCEYVSIWFEGNLIDAKPSCYSLDDFQNTDEFKNNLADLWRFGGKSEHYRCYSFFYNLLSYIEYIDKVTYLGKKNFSIIAPAVSYLKENIYNCDLKVEKLYQFCGISGTYFRKIFQSYYGMSPQNYILEKRLIHAKNIIDIGDFNCISDIATSIGYNDPLYFSRAFKKKFGVSPSKYAKEIF